MSARMFCVLWEAGLFIVCLLLGSYFYRSQGKASRFIAGYNSKSQEQRKSYDEDKLCKDYGRNMCWMSLIFLLGLGIDLKWTGRGVLVSVVCLAVAVMLHLLLINKNFDSEYKTPQCMRSEEYTSIINVEQKLDEADRVSQTAKERLSHDDLFRNVRK